MTTASAAQNARARAARLDRAGDLTGALSEYQAALALAPNDAQLLADVARLAERLGMHEVAAKLWSQVVRLEPARLEALDGQARGLRELGRFDEAIELLRSSLMAHPEDARLWNTLGVTLVQQGQTEPAITFFDEAVRLDPKLATALYNRAGAKFDLGRLGEAAADFAAARKHARRPADAAMIDFAAATLTLARGELAAGWEAYESRFAPDWVGAVAFEAPGRRWTPKLPVAGKRLLVLGEQGVGDEVMFASVIPDVIRDLGPEGRLTLAVEPRLVELMRRSFAEADVLAHETRTARGRPVRAAPALPERSRIDLWAPMGSLLRKYRTRLEDFPTAPSYLRPEPARVAHWRSWLGEGPPAVGLTWRSGQLLGDRRRHFPPLSAWRPVLATPGVRLISLQYGDTSEELPVLAEMAGQAILTPPDLDLKQDLDDLGALCAALDVAVGVPNATSQIAGAVGAPLVLVSAPAAWPQLGTDRYPWHPQAEVAAAASYDAWEDAVAYAATLMREFLAG